MKRGEDRVETGYGASCPSYSEATQAAGLALNQGWSLKGLSTEEQ